VATINKETNALQLVLLDILLHQEYASNVLILALNVPMLQVAYLVRQDI
jgi:hypothetical protein